MPVGAFLIFFGVLLILSWVAGAFGNSTQPGDATLLVIGGTLAGAGAVVVLWHGLFAILLRWGSP